MTDHAPRAATQQEIPEVVRLVGEMYSDMAEDYSGHRTIISADWAEKATTALAERLGEDVAVFVIERASGELASVAVGRLH